MSRLNKKYLFLLLILVQFTVYSQSFSMQGNVALFKDYSSNNPIVVVNDSLLYKGIALNKEKYKHSKYPDLLSNYVPLRNINDKTYLVHEGCGPILEYRNDSIVRVDNSFLHQSQFGSIKFIYRDNLYFFGGHGIFTDKNILTKYEFKTGEWQEVQTFGDYIPAPRRNAFGILIKDDLFVFGGFYKDLKNINSIIPIDDFVVWKLHLPTMEWKIEGFYKQQEGLKSDLLSFQKKNKLFLIGMKIYEYDFLNNKVKVYKNQNVISPKNIYYDELNDKIYHTHRYHTGEVRLFEEWFSSYLGELEKEEEFMSEEGLGKVEIGILILVIILFCILLFWKKVYPKLKPWKGIEFRKKNDSFFYKNNLIEQFDSNDLKILKYLAEKGNNYFPLNNLNKLFEGDLNNENNTTIIKRRDSAINNLELKLATIFGKTEFKLFLNRKSVEDKRVKEIKVVPNFLRVV